MVKGLNPTPPDWQDDEEAVFGDDGDFSIRYNKSQDRLEIVDKANNTIAYLLRSAAGDLVSLNELIGPSDVDGSGGTSGQILETDGSQSGVSWTDPSGSGSNSILDAIVLSGSGNVLVGFNGVGGTQQTSTVTLSGSASLLMIEHNVGAGEHVDINWRHPGETFKLLTAHENQGSAPEGARSSVWLVGDSNNQIEFEFSTSSAINDNASQIIEMAYI